MNPGGLRLSGLLLSGLLSLAVSAAAALQPGAISEFVVELPTELRALAGGRRLSKVQHALVAVALPKDFDPARTWPILVISATSDPTFNSSRRLLRSYAETATAAGWVALAADPQEKISPDEDGLPLRFALVATALGGLEIQWPAGAKAPLAFGGFSGGAKHSGWLAAEFATQGQVPLGVFQAGINEDTLTPAARQFKVANAAFRRLPVFLLGGRTDEIAPPAAHHAVERSLKRAGFRNVRLEFFDGPHVVDPRPLRLALEWFAAEAAKPAGK
ncbi:MAG: hypothetical protein HY302_05910 [Opitutae bacterium]|nr:hypothetical protein [Opitutae bacterium]